MIKANAGNNRLGLSGAVLPGIAQAPTYLDVPTEVEQPNLPPRGGSQSLSGKRGHVDG